MADTWYYERDGKMVGPISLANLQAAMPGMKDWRKQLVWRPGLQYWAEAGTLSEFVDMPPPFPSKAPSPPPVESFSSFTEPKPAATNKGWSLRSKLVGRLVCWW